MGNAVHHFRFIWRIWHIYPISALVYQRRENLEKDNRANEYKSKIEMQKSVIEKCISAGLHFSTVTGDACY